jgi:two-component system, OmpR family, phosphate regulon sensor histidine kinase PhoR
MKISDYKKQKFSAISYRTALPSAVVLSSFAFILLYAGSMAGFKNALLISFIFFPVSFVTVYLISARLHNERLKNLHGVVKNISKKKFRNYHKSPEDQKDEIDMILKRTVRASDTVSRELTRLNKIENYRKEFIGDISHELKTPIFAIQGFIETLLNGAIHDSDVNEIFLKKAMRNVNRLIYLTNDLMEISRLETGELKSNIKDVYLRDIVLDVVESLQYKANEEDIEIRVKNFEKNLQVKADRNQIKQVLVNLIENGMKYNKPGGYVEIGVNEYKKTDHKMLLYVKDTGIGMEKKDLNRVTERFFRVDKSRSREKGGTGLGLAIVKHIIEAHGEKLYIESTPELGSTFSITLTRTTPVLN